MHYKYLLLCNDSKTGQEVWDYTWDIQIRELLRQLMGRLSGAVETWGEFQRKEIGYFLYDGESPTASPSLGPSLDGIDKVFSNFKGCLRKLQDLEKELRGDRPPT